MSILLKVTKQTFRRCKYLKFCCLGKLSKNTDDSFGQKGRKQNIGNLECKCSDTTCHRLARSKSQFMDITYSKLNAILF